MRSSSSSVLPSETELDRLYIETINSVPKGREDPLVKLYGYTASMVSNVPTPARIFTAGICMNQSTSFMKAGSGIFCGTRSIHNKSIRVPGPSISEDRAHAYALWRAILDFPLDRPVIVYTSSYVLHALTTYADRNCRVNWSCANGDIFKNIVAKIQLRTAWMHLS
ncbi:hypothetical protein K435DRAFT_696142, partial [Dendrothele bispora CBS 962.96]